VVTLEYVTHRNRGGWIINQVKCKTECKFTADRCIVQFILCAELILIILVYIMVGPSIGGIWIGCIVNLIGIIYYI
jgi:hypothetical protein